MSEPASQIIEYFLGIEGEQRGPFSKEEISTMVNNGEISEDTPLWCSGMSDWAPIRSLEAFKKSEIDKSAQSKLSAVSGAREPKPNSKISQPPMEGINDELEPEVIHEFETVFSNSLNFKKVKSSQPSNKQLLLGGGFIVVLGLIIWMMNFDGTKQTVSNQAENLNPAQLRSLSLSKLQVQFNKNPKDTLPELLNLVKENPSDNAGLEALETLLSYYRRQQLFSEAGLVLMAAKKPIEALDYFLKDPPDYAQAEKAYEEAFKQSKGNDRRDLLLKQIDILIGRLGNIEKATTRIKILDKEFPGIPHPYQYYLKSTEERIADIFSRLSFHYVETLNNFITGELAQIQLAAKPLLSITKSRDNKYRIVASYKGPINLRNDLVPNVMFVFWQANEQWFIVDTNLTKERSKFAKEEQKKHEADLQTADELLQGLENLFRTQFPGKGLHELVAPPKRLPIGSVE